MGKKKRTTNVGIQSFRDRAPRLPEILFAVLGEKSREGGLFEKRAALVVCFGEFVDLPLASRNKNESTLTARGEILSFFSPTLVVYARECKWWYEKDTTIENLLFDVDRVPSYRQIVSVIPRDVE